MKTVTLEKLVVWLLHAATSAVVQTLVFLFNGLFREYDGAVALRLLLFGAALVCIDYFGSRLLIRRSEMKCKRRWLLHFPDLVLALPPLGFWIGLAAIRRLDAWNMPHDTILLIGLAVLDAAMLLGRIDLFRRTGRMDESGGRIS